MARLKNSYTWALQILEDRVGEKPQPLLSETSIYIISPQMFREFANRKNNNQSFEEWLLYKHEEVELE